MPQFSHLHVHSQYSLLDGAANIKAMMKKAQEDQMPAVALTDHGNMFGVFQFVNEAEKHGVKPIVGCEFYLVEDRFRKTFSKEQRDKRYHQLLLAKNKLGYHNISKLCSLGFIDGLYSKFPRIDKELLKQYKEGLIATTCCIGAEVPQAILRQGEEAAEKLFLEWLDLFGEDYYVELQRHHLENIDGTGLSQEDINQVLLKWAKKYDVKVIATNDSHYLDQDDWNAHDILLCVNTGDKRSTPKGQGRGFRFGFPNDQFFFKTQAEMLQLFKDIPEALDNTNEIVDKINTPQLKRDILLPNFTLPSGFTDMDDYLKHLTFEGARHKYSEISSEVEERLTHELKIIRDMGFAGYFLIVQDFMAAARDMGVALGPGRGSAAGSAVAFTIGITNIDPIRYKLLFERFLNPERVTMPDIDIDFDDEGRQRVIDWVVDKYGKNQVAQIITYGTMAAKSSIKDVSRVMELPLNEANMLAKMVPANPGMTLAKAYKEVPELSDIRGKKSDMQGEVLRLAENLEGSIRNTGIHAAGVIIAPDDITKYIPVCTSKDSDLLVTQFDGKYIEDAGMLKMDFLGLKTLTIIKDAIAMAKETQGVDIDPDEMPLDDVKTFELYQRGDTIGTFQFESEGMRMYLKELKPTVIEDLIAMNALYRPGPMQFIDTFIRRKHGQEEVEFPHELLEPILKDSYGIMVYQEQIMQTAQILAGYSLGGADLLRRAMGKKKMDVMEQQREVFIKGAKELHDIPKEKSSDVFGVMMKFAEYGFNRSHSAAYSVVAFQTGYMKANYPAEYMSSVLTHNMADIKKITFFMEECVRMGIKVLGPDVNESAYKFNVNAKGEIRFGLGAVKGVGEGAVEALVNERKENGPYKNVFDLTKRVNLRATNKKSMESLALAGAFDCFEGVYRSQYFFSETAEGNTLLELAIRFGASYQAQQDAAQQSLFGGGSTVELPEPEIPKCQPWPKLELLAREREVTGMYISGHPLDDFKLEIENFCTHSVSELKDLVPLKNKEISFAGILSEVTHRTTKRGKPFGMFNIEDYTDSTQIFMFGDDYINNRNMLQNNWFVYMKGKVRARFNDENNLELKIHKIEMLSDLKEKMAKSLTIKLNLSEVTEELIDKMSVWVDTYQGKCQLKIQLADPLEQNLKVTLPVRKGGVDLSNELIDELNKSKLMYKVN
ncbi:MAG: DNA polymerase III subunit alpha [Salibacteraceae bacterium]